jgi:transposase
METNQPDTANVTYVGLDVSKDRLDYTVDGQRCDHVPNTEAGLLKLTAILRKLTPPARVVCEATGGYERAAVAALLTARLEACVVNPGRVRAFAHAEGQLAKTDRLDARLLRRFGEKVRPRLHVPMDASAVVLRELLEYRRQVSDQLVAVRNRLELAGRTLRALLDKQVRFLEAQLEDAERLIRDHIDHDDDLRGKAGRLRQLKGVGPVLAATLLAYVPELGKIEDKSLSCLIGVAPFARDSGKGEARRRVRGGRATVRHVLYMAAVAATRHNRLLGEFYQRLREAGKPAAVALVAVMRKMLRVLNRLLADPHFALAQ